MIVLDSNTVITGFENKHKFATDQFIVPDSLYEEYQVAEVRHKEQVRGVTLASTLKGYDEAYYLSEYAKALNSYSQVSFAKMRGFGDVSIIALVGCLATDFGRKLPQTAFDFGNDAPVKVRVVTNDNNLRKKLKKDFEGQVELISYDDFIKS